MTKHQFVFFIGLTTLALVAPAHAQSYTSGRPVWPAYEGWMKNDDGTIDFLFGYMNENWQEEVEVPVGSDNSFTPGPADVGQPTRFLPRRNRFMFKVRVPKDFGEKELIWTLTSHGNAAKAYASLKTDLLLENIDIMSETGALGAGTSSPEVRANQPPAVKLEGPKTRTAKVGQPLTLSAVVTDDGVPKRRGQGGRGVAAPEQVAALLRTATPEQTQQLRTLLGVSGSAASSPEQLVALLRAAPPDQLQQLQTLLTGSRFTPPLRGTVGKVTGLHLSWFVYRGGKGVSFDPPQIKVWEDTRAGSNSPWGSPWTPPELPADGRWTAHVTFAEPGVYVLHGRADDGGLYADEDVTVTVTP